MIIKGIIFDLDGTLVNSIEDLAFSMNLVLEKLGFPTHTLATYQHFVGHGLMHLIKAALPADKADEAIVDRAKQMMLETYWENCTRHTHIYNGIKELLENLSSKGYKLAVLSNKIDAFTKKIIRKHFPGIHFEQVTGLSDRFPKKPAPDAANYICKMMDCQPQETIFVGDTEVDLQTSNNAGIEMVAALWGFRTREELLDAGAKITIETPMQLLEVLESKLI